MNIVTKLNHRQHEAVTHGEGPVLVLAGAGSGKTRVITHRIVHLMRSLAVEPRRILAVTFTNKAAGEMKERVLALLEPNPSTSTHPAPLIATFHSLCVRILRRQIERLSDGFTRDFSIYDDDDQQRLIRQCLRELGIDERQITPRSVGALISHAKNHVADPIRYLAEGGYQRDALKQTVASVFPLYLRRMRTSNALDFDDLLLKTVELLSTRAEVREDYAERFQYVLVDEYQDTNRPQFLLIKLLTSRYQNLCVVGDPDQSIYKFRGADIQNIIDFENHFPTAQVITLDQNYRSTQRILDTANAVISHNAQRREKQLRTENEAGDLVKTFYAESGESEARFVMEEIRTHLRSEEGTRIAVLYRTNAQSRLFEEECRRAGIAFNIIGGFSFYKRAEIRDMLAYLKLALNLWDDESLLRIINTPSRGLGKKTTDLITDTGRTRGVSLWESLSLILAEQMLPAKTLQALAAFRETMILLGERARQAGIAAAVGAAVEETGYAQALRQKSMADLRPQEHEARLLNLEEMRSAAVEAESRGESVRDFIDHAALVSDTDDYEPEARVTLMTMHSAKGLEFSIVHVVGLEDGLFPHSRSREDPKEMEEERRLFYVAITRAQRRLYLSHARVRRLRGEMKICEPSRFLKEIPEELQEFRSNVQDVQETARRDKAGTDRFASAGGQAPAREKPRQAFGGKTYNTIDGVQEFLKRRGAGPPSVDEPDDRRVEEPTNHVRFLVGARVRHEMYGLGTVIKREGAGEKVKLTISFPGYGHRTMIERLVKLQRV